MDILERKITQSGNTEKTWEISPYVFFGLCGFTLYLAWMFVIYISPALSPESGYSALNIPSAMPVRYYLRFVMLAALLLSLVVCRMLTDWLSSRRGIKLLFIGSMVLNTLALILLSIQGEIHLAAYLSFVLLGIAQSFMILLWSSFLSMIGERHILLFVAFCVGCAAVITILMLFLQPLAAAWITYSLSLLSMVCFMFIHYRQTESHRPLLVKAKDSDERSSITRKSAISVVFYSVALGFSIYYIAAKGADLLGPLLVGLAVLLASVIIILDSTLFHRLSESLLAKLHLPALLVGLVPMFFSIELLRVLGIAFLVCFLMIIYILNLSALSEHVRIDNLNSIRIFSYGRAGNTLGFVIGAFTCFLAFTAPSIFAISGAMDDRSWVGLIMFVVMGLFTIGSSFVFEDHYPVDSGNRANEPRSGTRNPLPSNSLKSLSGHMLDSMEKPQSVQAGTWSKRINALSAEYGLSPRETEVLFLLAKGRNAEYIQDDLVVSRHTAKAHIYHIYQKTGVHSRQELINIMEKMDIDND